MEDTIQSASSFVLFLLLVGSGIIAISYASIGEGIEESKGELVRDRFYIWTHPAGSHNHYDLGNGQLVNSRMTPVEGAMYLGVPNLYFVNFSGKPPISEYRKYGIAFRPLKRVVWLLTGMGGETSADLRNQVLDLAQQFPNTAGFVLDDFIKWSVSTPRVPHWLAANHAPFPVTLNLVAPKPVACDRIQLVQSDWVTGDYRSKDFVVEILDADLKRHVVNGSLPNEGGAVVTVDFPRVEVQKLSVQILNTHDHGQAQSCGLREIRIFDGDVEVSTKGWTAEASSTYSDAYRAQNLFVSTLPQVQPDNGSDPVSAVMTPAELKALRDEIRLRTGNLPLICVVYTNQISPRIMPHIAHVDKVAMWTWIADDLKDLQQNFERLESLVKPKPILLGCYLFDYGRNKPMSVEDMRLQCELGLQWLKEGRIEGMIFLGSNVCDQELDAVEWTRKWIAKVGPEVLLREP